MWDYLVHAVAVITLFLVKENYPQLFLFCKEKNPLWRIKYVRKICVLFYRLLMDNMAIFADVYAADFSETKAETPVSNNKKVVNDDKKVDNNSKNNNKKVDNNDKNNDKNNNKKQDVIIKITRKNTNMNIIFADIKNEKLRDTFKFFMGLNVNYFDVFIEEYVGKTVYRVFINFPFAITFSKDIHRNLNKIIDEFNAKNRIFTEIKDRKIEYVLHINNTEKGAELINKSQFDLVTEEQQLEEINDFVKTNCFNRYVSYIKGVETKNYVSNLSDNKDGFFLNSIYFKSLHDMRNHIFLTFQEIKYHPSSMSCDEILPNYIFEDNLLKEWLGMDVNKPECINNSNSTNNNNTDQNDDNNNNNNEKYKNDMKNILMANEYHMSDDILRNLNYSFLKFMGKKKNIYDDQGFVCDNIVYDEDISENSNDSNNSNDASNTSNNDNDKKDEIINENFYENFIQNDESGRLEEKVKSNDKKKNLFNIPNDKDPLINFLFNNKIDNDLKDEINIDFSRDNQIECKTDQRDFRKFHFDES